MQLPVIKALGASFAYLIAHAGGLVRVLWLPVLAMSAANFVLMPSQLKNAMALSALGEAPDPALVMQSIGPMLTTMGLIYLVFAIFWPMTIAGTLRHLIRGQSPGLPFYLQFRMDELRILLSYLLLVVMFGLAYAAAALGIVVMGAIGALAGGTLGGAILAVMFLAVLTALFWFLVRMSLTFPATIDMNRIGIAESWRVTRGHAGSLFLYFLVWMIIFIALAVAFFAIAMPGMFGMFAEYSQSMRNGVTSAEFERRMIEMQLALFDPGNPQFFIFAGATYIYTIMSTAILNVSTGVAYRYLSGDEQR